MSAVPQAGLALGGAVLGVVAVLFQRILRPAREIDRYAAEVDTAVGAIARNTDVAGELSQTRDLAAAMPALAGRYLERPGREGG